MKKIIIFVFIVTLFFTSNTLAFTPYESTETSGEKTADATILTGAGFFKQIVIMPDGTNPVTVSIYDNTAASGTELLPTMTFAGNGGAQASPPVWIKVRTGITVDITTEGTVGYTILYRGK